MKERLKVLSVMLMVFSLSLTVVSCSDDDDDKVNNSIVGTWEFKSASTGEIKTNSTVNDEKIKPAIISSATEDYSGSIITFEKDGTYQETIEGEPELNTGTYTFSDGVLTLFNGSGDEVDSIKAVVENGILTIDEDYTSYCNRLQPDKLSELGISDPTDFTVTKAIAKISFSRQQ